MATPPPRHDHQAADLLAAGLRDPDETQTLGGKPGALPDLAQLARLLPRYDGFTLHGRGGMGAVYRARHRQLDRTVAIKVMIPATDRPDTVARFTTEAQALARLDHPHIVAVHDVGQAEGLCWLVMEFHRWSDVEASDGSRAARTGGSPGDGHGHLLGAAIRPRPGRGASGHQTRNVLIDRQGVVRIADFGLARLLDPTGRSAPDTRSGAVMGTPHYMAPEQIERPREVDHRADLYALGVVFYELLTGELPLGRFDPPSHRVVVDVRLDQVVLRALEKSPERRYQQASHIHTEVAGIARTPAPRPRRRSVGLIIGLAAAGLLVLAAIVMWLTRPAPTSDAPIPQLLDLALSDAGNCGTNASPR